LLIFHVLEVLSWWYREEPSGDSGPYQPIFWAAVEKREQK
jgi:hypothetical protein